VNVDVSDVQLKVLTLSRQFIATIGMFEATRFCFLIMGISLIPLMQLHCVVPNCKVQSLHTVRAGCSTYRYTLTLNCSIVCYVWFRRTL